MPELSVVIVSWNVKSLLRQCLASLESVQERLPLEVIVVDSSSGDGTIPMIRSDFPWVRALPQAENVGFTRGNNIGLAQAKGRFLLLLNPDTVVVNDAIDRMLAYMEEHQSVGVLGPQLCYPDGSIQSSRRRFPTLATGFFESTWLQSLAPRKLLQRYYAQDLPDDAVSEVDWVTGACLMVRQKAYQQVGPLDEGYFMYSEEMEWQHRIKDAGWKIVYDPSARVIHHEGKSSEQVSTQRHIYFQQSKLRYYRQYHGPAAATVLRVFILGNYVWQLALEAIKGLLGSNRPLRRQRISAYWQVLRTGLPPAGS